MARKTPGPSKAQVCELAEQYLKQHFNENEMAAFGRLSAKLDRFDPGYGYWVAAIAYGNHVVGEIEFHPDGTFMRASRPEQVSQKIRFIAYNP